MIKLTEHFHLEEFKALPNNATHYNNFFMLAHFCLEPVRRRFGPVTITSGYRSPEYNKSVGGSKTSQHVKAEAADFIVPGANSAEVFVFLCNELDWPGQVFRYLKKGNLHVGIPRLGIKPTRKIMEAR